mmetsp:Transcript_54017/g.110526  ORF Transcript_54017/g.110526 Transcript_54017/m.110526 type:complete len:447 (+) Transcript_54017:153-1493(+)
MTTPESPESEALPRRCIFDDADMRSFTGSSTKTELLGFVEAMGKACASTGSSDEGGAASYSYDPERPLTNLPPAMACLHGSLQEMARWVDDFPPETASGGAISIRFGNPSFKKWHERLLERSEDIITTILKTRDDDESPTPELACQRGRDAASGALQPRGDGSVRQVSPYLHDSFGHAIRLDYGTGHESSFLVFLLILSKVKCIGNESDLSSSLVALKAVTVSILDQYLKVTRRLQTEYRLEPAGSHGVWGLDDYHCLPLYFGACQLKGAGRSVSQDLLDPKCIMDERVIQEHGDAYMYLGCIRYIRELKKGVPFFESSPMLYDISQTIPSWDKVARGLIRLYQGEVLNKRVVVQHFMFSRLFPCTWTPSRSGLREAPTETFRESTYEKTSSQTTIPVPSTRAPWAGAAAPSDTTAGLTGTRAPWAKLPPSDDITDLVTTRAPWAK